MSTLALASVFLLGAGPCDSECGSDDDCNGDDLCVEGACVECEDDGDCDGGEICDDGDCERSNEEGEEGEGEEGEGEEGEGEEGEGEEGEEGEGEEGEGEEGEGEEGEGEGEPPQPCTVDTDCDAGFICSSEVCTCDVSSLFFTCALQSLNVDPVACACTADDSCSAHIGAGANDGCDCGCGVEDPDCGGAGCTEPGCEVPDECVFCWTDETTGQSC